MTTLRLEHAISDFDLWKSAFDRDPIGREQLGVRARSRRAMVSRS